MPGRGLWQKAEVLLQLQEVNYFDIIENEFQILNFRHMIRTHKKAKEEAENIVEASRREKLEKWKRKQKCPEVGCRRTFTIKKSMEIHLQKHGWEKALIKDHVGSQPEPAWLVLSDSDED